MKIEVGKYYKTRDGRKALVVKTGRPGRSDHWWARIGNNPAAWDTAFYEDGRVWDNRDEGRDLVAPWTAEDEVKRRAEAGEPKFKVGDTVEILKSRHGAPPDNNGQRGRVEETTPHHGVKTPRFTNLFYYHDDELQLLAEAPPPSAASAAAAVAPAPDSLEELVKRANDGIQALAKIHCTPGLKDDVEFSGYGVSWERLRSFGNACSNDTKLRVRPKPAFEPFRVGDNWEVKLDGDTLHVGCQKFTAAWARTALRGLCRDGVTQSDGMVPIVATRSGVRWGGDELSWPDADKILAALEKVT